MSGHFRIREVHGWSGTTEDTRDYSASFPAAESEGSGGGGAGWGMRWKLANKKEKECLKREISSETLHHNDPSLNKSNSLDESEAKFTKLPQATNGGWHGNHEQRTLSIS